MRYLFIPELKQYFSSCGFSYKSDYRWMEKTPLIGNNSWYGLIVVKK